MRKIILCVTFFILLSFLGCESVKPIPDKSAACYGIYTVSLQQNDHSEKCLLKIQENETAIEYISEGSPLKGMTEKTAGSVTSVSFHEMTLESEEDLSPSRKISEAIFLLKDAYWAKSEDDSRLCCCIEKETKRIYCEKDADTGRLITLRIRSNGIDCNVIFDEKITNLETCST